MKRWNETTQRWYDPLVAVRRLRKALEPFVQGKVDYGRYVIADWAALDAKVQKAEQLMMEQEKKEEAD